MAFELRDYVQTNLGRPFREWFDSLDDTASAKVFSYMERLELGNFSNVKGVGEGVSELRIDFGPGYRIYFARDGVELIILLGGGSKQRQQLDIAAAQRRWADYKARKRAMR